MLNSKLLPLDTSCGAIEIAKRIKKDIRREIGSWITCSVGIGPNKFLAKLGSDLEKPDGLVIINEENKDEILLSCKLTDFCGIAGRTERRLNRLGIYTVKELREADSLVLRKEFGVYGIKMQNMAWGKDGSEVLDWHFQADAKSFGHSRTLNRDVAKREELSGQLYLLSEKVAKRMRDEGYFGKEVGVWIRFNDFSGTGKRHRIGYFLNDGYEIYKEARKILDEIYFSRSNGNNADIFDCHSGIAPWNGQYPESRNIKQLDPCLRRDDRRKFILISERGQNRIAPKWRKDSGSSSAMLWAGRQQNCAKPVRAMGVYVTRLSKDVPRYLFESDQKKEKILKTMDKINNKYGEDTLFKGTLLNFPFKKIVSGMGRKKF